MRMMMKVAIPVEAGNRGIKDGVLPKVIQTFMESAKPEAAYFTAEHGRRTAFFVVDMKDTTQIPSLAEPFFMELNASIDFMPVMTPQDLKAGLEALPKK